MSTKRQRAAIAGLAVLAGLLLVVTASGADASDSKAAGGEWRRLQLEQAGFGSRGLPTAIRTGGPGFIATGVIEARDPNDEGSPAMWTSEDGEEWSRVPPAAAKLGDGVNVATRRGISVGVSGEGVVIRSRDGRHWKRVARLSGIPRARPKTDSYLAERSFYVAPGPHGFIAIMWNPEPSWTALTWSSSPDGRRWERTDSVGTEAVPVGLTPRAPLRNLWLAVTSVPPDASTGYALFTSTDGVHWVKGAGTEPERFAPQVRETHDRRSVLAIQYEPPNGLGGRLWRTRDTKTWTEITSFHRAMPNGNPDHLVQSGHWWVLGGFNGEPGTRKFHASMWSSPDLEHWYEMPANLQGKQGAQVAVFAANGRVVGFRSTSQFPKPVLWVWNPPE